MYQGLSYEIGQVMTEANATSLFVSLCTIQQPNGVYDASGFPSGVFVAISSALTNIPCTAPPLRVTSIGATEKKMIEGNETYIPRHVLLNGYYSGIPYASSTRPNLRAVIDGENFEIMGVEHDSQKQMTRLEVRAVSR